MQLIISAYPQTICALNELYDRILWWLEAYIKINLLSNVSKPWSSPDMSCFPSCTKCHVHGVKYFDYIPNEVKYMPSSNRFSSKHGRTSHFSMSRIRIELTNNNNNNNNNNNKGPPSQQNELTSKKQNKTKHQVRPCFKVQQIMHVQQWTLNMANFHSDMIT